MRTQPLLESIQIRFSHESSDLKTYKGPLRGMTTICNNLEGAAYLQLAERYGGQH